jgi:hypothetical protein
MEDIDLTNVLTNVIEDDIITVFYMPYITSLTSNKYLNLNCERFNPFGRFYVEKSAPVYGRMEKNK